MLEAVFMEAPITERSLIEELAVCSDEPIACDWRRL